MLHNFVTIGKIPKRVPKEMTEWILKLKKSKNKKDCLKKAYNFMTRRYRGYRWETLLHPHYFFLSDINSMWYKTNFLLCSNLNYILIVLLIKSGLFKKKDLQLKWTNTLLISPHQYVKVNVDEKEAINIDIWGKAYGIPFGEYAHGWK